MLYPGIVSVTFRNKTPEEVVTLAKTTGMRGIEWGSDVHLPPGQNDVARQIRRLMDDNGLYSPSYGTYYHAGGNDNPPFEALIENALIIGAPVLRVWTGQWEDSAGMSSLRRKEITEDLRRICELAARAGLTVSTEYHPKSLTDTFESTQQLLSDIPELMTHWQADEGRAGEGHPRVLKALLPRITVVHVSWWQGGRQFPLSQGGQIWEEYIDILKSSVNDHFLMLEFVKDGSVEQFLEDAVTLKELLA